VAKEHTGQSAHSIDDAVRDAAKKVDKKASFRLSEIRGEISPNPGTINKFVAIIEVTD
jgi:hypothetical protein